MMYSMRVEPGMERIQVPNGIVPTYLSAAAATMNKRLRVVPGYVFTRTKKDGAERVPEEEWKAIEAISSTYPSSLDVVTCRIIDGPLKDLPILQIDPAVKAVLIRMNLLGETREYWLPVRFADPSDKKPKEKVVYTDEQRAEMLARAEKVGVKAAADAFGVPWQTIAQLRRWAAKSGEGEGTDGRPSRMKKPAPGKAVSLFVENAVLRERIASLQGTIEKMERILADLR